MADTFKGIITADGKKRQLPYGSVLDKPASDETLSIQGAFADAKAVGDKFKTVKAETDSLKEDLVNYDKEIASFTDEKNRKIALDIVIGSVINGTTGKVEAASTSFCTSEYLLDNSDIYLYVTANVGFGYYVFAFYDENNKFINGLKSPSNGYMPITNEKVIIPLNAKKIVVSSKNKNEKASISSFIGRDIRGYSDIQQKVSSIKFKSVYNEEHLTSIPNRIIDSSGAVTTFASDSYIVTDYVPVSGGDIIKITAGTNWGNALYAFYNESFSCVEVGDIANNIKDYTVIDKKEVTVPIGSKYIAISENANRPDYAAKLFKKNGYVIDNGYIGKKWVCVGDSLTENNSATTKHYQDYIAEELGVDIINMGVGGSGYMRGQDTSKAFYQRVLNVPTSANVVTVFGGGNDCNLSVIPYDKLGDVTDSGTDTICGCINKTLDNYYTVMPTVPIGIITPSHWQQFPTSDKTNRMEKVVEKLIEIAEMRSVPILDLYHCSSLRPWDETNRNECFSNGDNLDGNGDGVHPNELGHKIISSKIREFIKTLI